MVRVFGANLTDITDRIARQLGETRIQDGDGSTLLDILAAAIDAQPTTTNPMFVYGPMGLYNGATLDRARSVGAGTGLSTGLLASGMYGYDGVDWERLIAEGGGDARSNASLGLVANARLEAFNGATWDRLRNMVDGEPRFGLGVGLPERAALYGASAYSAFYGPLSPAANGNTIICRLRNPVGSGEQHVVTRLVLRCNAARGFTVRAVTPALADLATAEAETNRRVGGAAATAIATSNNASPASGGNIVYQGILEPDVLLVLPIEFLLPADASLDIHFSDGANVTTDVFNATIDWYEETA
jgi:hypothetical protein